VAVAWVIACLMSIALVCSVSYLAINSILYIAHKMLDAMSE
jgi:hypothetical protein